MSVLTRVLSAQNAVIRRSVAGGDQEFFDPYDFSWVPTLEASFPRIRAEVDGLLSVKDRLPAFHEVSSRAGARRLSDQRWKAFFLRIYGHDIADAERLCPETMAAIRRVSDVTLATFSILEPGKEIPPHCGPTKGVLRYHLGIVVPSGGPDCAIRVGRETRTWSEGRSLVFDDHFQHSAWNLTSEPRVILYLDFLRPMPAWLSLPNRAFLRAVSSFHPDVARSLANAEAFARRLASAAPERD
jgi:aspartyl/asparaginyl beta-hydroxylase (cupin superfamily)